MKTTSPQKEKFQIRLLKPDILEIKLFDYVDLTEEDFKEIKVINEELTKGKPYGLFIEIGSFLRVNKDFVALTAYQKNAPNTIARSVYTNSKGGQLGMNFYLSFRKPEVPTKAFINKEKALAWLEEKVKVNTK